MGRAAKNLHRSLKAGKGKENYTKAPEHKTKQVATSVPAVKGGNAPLHQHKNHPNCD